VFATAAGCSGAGSVPPPQSQPSGPPAVTNPISAVGADAIDRSTAVRDLLIVYPGQAGYPVGGSAPLTLKLGNNTTEPITLTNVTAAGGTEVMLIGGSVESAAPGGKEFEVLVPPGTLLPLAPENGRYLEIRCLPVALTPDMTVKLTFSFDNGSKLTADVPMGAPYVEGQKFKPLRGAKGAKPGQAC
jgi:hypothetical protein